MLVALAAWPVLAARGNVADVAAPAPLRDDATIRRATIAFEETRERADSLDQLTPRMLASEYLQRYREQGDVGDILRAQSAAERSLRIAPRGNEGALLELASAQLALHRFRDALRTVRRAAAGNVPAGTVAMMEASLDLELGDRAGARRLLARFGNGNNDASAVVGSRYAELTGDLARARLLIGGASARADATYGLPNERRAWFHARAGELAFEAGDVASALDEEGTALARFPDDVMALTDTARFAAAAGHWSDAQSAATRAVARMPSPENLGLLADAQSQAGDAVSAAATRDEIGAVERLGNAQHLVDRLLALYYADHGIALDRAYAIALRDRALRDDPYTEDAIAWTAARSGRWGAARAAAAKATAWHTADSRLLYHAGVIAEHAGDRGGALRDYRAALALNPHFAPVYADDARARIARL